MPRIGFTRRARRRFSRNASTSRTRQTPTLLLGVRKIGGGNWPLRSQRSNVQVETPSASQISARRKTVMPALADFSMDWVGIARTPFVARPVNGHAALTNGSGEVVRWDLTACSHRYRAFHLVGAKHAPGFTRAAACGPLTSKPLNALQFAVGALSFGRSVWAPNRYPEGTIENEYKDRNHAAQAFM
jgi:hypothetical protein